MKSRVGHLSMLVLALATLTRLAVAQTPFNQNGDAKAEPTTPKLGGKPTIDLITLRSAMPGVPLRFGNLIPDSEAIEFDGQRLEKGRDYQIDYASGVIYLMRAQKPGQTIRVSYRYDDQKSPQATGQTLNFSTALPTFKFNLTPGGSRAIIGLGMAERQSDGNVVMSNLYGVETKASGLKGLMLVGERAKVDNRSGFEYRDRPGETPEGKSKFVLQDFSTGLGGGSLDLSFQDISSNFAGFGAVREAGYAEDRVNQLSKERGLKRFGLGMRDVRVGSGKLNNSFRQVRDGDASIDWRSFGFDTGKAKFDFRSQRVDSDFRRFDDLTEGDREQLKKEVGLSRQDFSGQWADRFGSLSFSNSKVENAEGGGIYRRQVTLQTPSLGLSFGDQTVDQDFRRFDSLFEQERGQWGREAGLQRKWLALEAAVKGKEKQPLFRRSTLESNSGKFEAVDLNLKSGTVSLDHVSRRTDATFGHLRSLGEGEMDQNIRSIAQMYDPNQAARPEDRHHFLQSAGIDRSFTRLAAVPFKGWSFAFQKFEMKGENDKTTVDQAQLSSGDKFSAWYRRQDQGEHFNEIGRTMEFERQRLGMVSGLEKTDFGLNYKMSRQREVQVSSMVAQHTTGDASRKSISYRDPKLQVEVNQRKVDAEFQQVAGLVDNEKELLHSLRGFEQQDVKLVWQLRQNLKVDLFQFSANSPLTEQDNVLSAFTLNWQPDRQTDVTFHRLRHKHDDPMKVLFANAVDRISVSRNLGRFGRLQYLNEKINLDGEWNQQPDTKREYLAYETQINPTTALKSEQTRTQFSNGDKEDISTNTVSTEITKKAGVSLTDIQINRNGDDRDETRRNYGFWFDFGRGLRLNYGYNRQIQGDQGTLNSSVSITPGTLDFLNVQSASYTENRWDHQRTQGLTNIALGSSRPLNLGLLRNANFSFSMDTATDHSQWVRENRLAAFNGMIGPNKLAVEYRSQMHASGVRGIDRSIALETDPQEKNWLRGHVRYTARQVPGGEDVMIRDLGFTLKPKNGLTLSHQMLTNPEENRPRHDLPMFKYTSPWRVNKWDLKWDLNAANSLTGTWEERLNDQSRESFRLSGITFDLFKNSGSPLSFFYGVEQRWGNVDRWTAHRYWLRYDQKPGPNQVFSLYAGNVSYRGALPGQAQRENWTLNVNYQIRF